MIRVKGLAKGKEEASRVWGILAKWIYGFNRIFAEGRQAKVLLRVGHEELIR